MAPAKTFFKVQDIFNGSTAELINALIVIANNAYIVGTTGQQAHQVELGHAGILVFVHQHSRVPRADGAAQAGALVLRCQQQFQRHVLQVCIVQHFFLPV